MLLGILSDTHDRLQRTIKAVERLQAAGAEQLVHCGDFTTSDIVHACSVLPFACVLGNNDYDARSIRAAVEAVGGRHLELGGEFELAGKRIAVTHGDRLRTLRSLQEAGPDYLFYGHTHVAADERVGPTRMINPGALHRASRYTVALLDLKRDVLTLLPID